MGCTSSKSGLILSQTNKNAHMGRGARFPANAKDAGHLASKDPRKMSLPGDTIPQRRRLSVVHIDGTGVVDENIDRYV